MSGSWTRRARALTLVGPGRRFRRLIGWRILSIAIPAAATALIVWLFIDEAVAGIERAGTISVVWSVYWAAVLFATTTIVLAFRNLFLRSENIRARRRTRYILDEPLAEGSAGAVFKAHSEMLRRPVAIKLLRPESMSPRRIAEFDRAANVLCGLTHPNTVDVFDFGRTPKGLLYCVMEYVDGLTLRDLVLVADAVPQGRVVHILEQVCGSLAEAHRHRLIHLDLKPSNVMLTVRGDMHDFVKVLDFGLAKELQAEEVIGARPEALSGTPPYVAPERVVDPSIATPASDLYAVGAMAYALLTGRRVFRGETSDILRRVVSEDPEPPRSVTSLPISPKLEEIVMMLLSRDPAARHPTADALLTELRALDDIGAWTERDARRWWLANKGQIDRSRETVLEDLGRSVR